MSTATAKDKHGHTDQKVQELPHAAVRFAGDSGDGMQLAGTQFTNASAVFGNDVSTFPDYPSEIRAPAGTLGGVSGFQINFSSHKIHTPGDRIDALLAMNPAALKTNLKDLVEGGVLIVNADEFTKSNLSRAKYDSNPLEDGSLANYRLYAVPITSQAIEAVKEVNLNTKSALRCRNFYALGIISWLYDRPLETTLRWIGDKFGKVPAVAKANELALRAGHIFGETAEIFPMRYRVQPAKLKPGTYRNMTGNQAAAFGCITAAQLAKKPLFYGSYPITPASDILHELARHKRFDVRTFQAEDEIAAMASIIGAAFAGNIAVTGTSGPGMALKQEAIGLAVMTELPCVIINVQRGGPSTGLPTKTEQSDLWQAIVGRNGECPAPVLAAQSPGDCFWAVIEAINVAVKYMTPVILLSDGYVANSSEPWRIPDPEELKPIEIVHATDPATYQPYERDKNGARPWAIPGTPGLQHRPGGLEKADGSGHVCYEPENHQKMVELRAQKVTNVVQDVPDQEVYGEAQGDLLLVSWGGTYGAVRTATEQLIQNGHAAAHMHMRWLYPMPKNVEQILKNYKQVLVCELNLGQLQTLLQANYKIETVGLHKVMGLPFRVVDIVEHAENVLGGK